MQKFLLLSLLIILPNSLLASDYIANIVSFSNIETIIHIIYFGLLSFLSYIFYDVLGPETVFLFTSVVLIVLMMIKKTLVFEFDKYFEPIYKSPLNNIFVKYIIFLVLLHTLLAPVEINSFKLKQEKYMSALNQVVIDTDVISYENDSLFLISNIIKDFSINTLGQEIKTRAPLILVAPIMAYQRIIYGVPQLEKINNGDLFMSDVDENIYLISLIDKFSSRLNFKSKMRNSTADFTYLFQSYLNFLPNATQDLASSKILYSIGYDKINKFMNNYKMAQSLYNIYPEIYTENENSFYSIDSPLFKEYMSNETKNLLLLLTQYKIVIKNKYFSIIYNQLKNTQDIPTSLGNNNNIARQFILEFLLNTFSFNKTFKAIKDYTIGDDGKNFYNSIAKKGTYTNGFNSTLRTIIAYEKGDLDVLSKFQMYAIKYYLLNLFFKEDNDKNLIAKIKTEKDLYDSDEIKSLIDIGFDALKIAIDFDGKKNSFAEETMKINSSFSYDSSKLADNFFNIENIDNKYYEKVELDPNFSKEIGKKLSKEWGELTSNKRNVNFIDYDNILKELKNTSNLGVLDKYINIFLKTTMKLAVKSIIKNKKALNDEFKIYQIIDYIISIQDKKSMKIGEIKDKIDDNLPIRLGFSNLAYIPGDKKSYENLKMSVVNDFYNKAEKEDYSTSYNSSDKTLQDFYSKTNMVNLREILKDSKVPISKFIISKIRMNNNPSYSINFDLTKEDYKYIYSDSDITNFQKKYFNNVQNNDKIVKKGMFYDKFDYNVDIANFKTSKLMPNNLQQELNNEKYKLFNMFKKDNNDELKGEMKSENLIKIEEAQNKCILGIKGEQEKNKNIYLEDSKAIDCDYANNIITISKTKLKKMHDFYIKEAIQNRNKLNKFLEIKMDKYSKLVKSELDKKDVVNMKTIYDQKIENFSAENEIEKEYKDFNISIDSSNETVFEPTLITAITKSITFLSGTILVSFDNKYPDLTGMEWVNLSMLGYYLYGPDIEIGPINIKTLMSAILLSGNAVEMTNNSYKENIKKEMGNKSDDVFTKINTDQDGKEIEKGFFDIEIFNMEYIKNVMINIGVYALNFFMSLVLLFIYLFFVLYVIYIFFKLIFVFYFKYFIQLFELLFSFIKSFKVFIMSDVEELRKELENVFDNIKDFFIFNLMFVFLIMGLIFIQAIIYYITLYMNNNMDLTSSNQTILLSIVASLVMIVLLKGLNHIIFTLLLDSDASGGLTIGNYTDAISSSVNNSKSVIKTKSYKEKENNIEATNKLNNSINSLVHVLTKKNEEKKDNKSDRGDNMTNAGEIGS